MIITNCLTSAQMDSIIQLENLCKDKEDLKGNIFLSGELNFDENLDCFYLLYNPDQTDELIGFLSIFAPSRAEAELYAYTHPAFRERGCFNSLLEEALKKLSVYSIENILFVHEPNGKAAQKVLRTLDAVYQYSEFFMTWNGRLGLQPRKEHEVTLVEAVEEDLELLVSVHCDAFQELEEEAHDFIGYVLKKRDTCAYKLMRDDKGIGMCACSLLAGQDMLFGIGIRREYQGKGYGEELVRQFLANFRRVTSVVTLEVSSRNQPALCLYKKMGFEITTQFDYSLGYCEYLLELLE